MASKRPCIICGKETASRSGTTGWKRHTPKCRDAIACARRRDQARAHPKGYADIGGERIYF